MHELLHRYISEKVSIDDQAFSAIKEAFESKKVKRGEILLRSGDTCKHNYFVNSGCLRFYAINKEGQELTRYFAFPGKFGTALSSFIEQKPSQEFVEAVVASEILTISRAKFYEFVERIPAFNLIYRDILEMAYITSQERIYGLQGDAALDRLKWLMEYQPKILSKLSNKVIASYLGVTPFTLSRLKSEL